MINVKFPFTVASPTSERIRHGCGVSGYSHRWVGTDITTAVDAVATTWTDYVGGLVLAGTNGPTVKALGDGRKYLQFDGTDDTIKNDAIPSGHVMTAIVVAKMRGSSATTHQVLTGTGTLLQRANTYIQLAGGGTVQTNTINMNDQWRFLAATANGTTGGLTVDSVKVSAALTGVWGTNLRLGANGTPANFAPVDVIEVITYPTILSDADIATIRTALKANYSSQLV